MISHSKNSSLNLADMGVMLIGAWYYVYPLAALSVNFTFILILFLAYVFIADFIQYEAIKKRTLQCVFVIAYIALLYVLLTETRSISAGAGGFEIKRFVSKFYQIFMMFFPVYLSGRFIQMATRNEIFTSLVVSLAFIGFVLFNTLKETTTNVSAARAFGAAAELAEKGVGGYYFVYAVPFLCVFCAIIASKINKGAKKLILYLFTGFLFFFLIKAGYTISVIITLIGGISWFWRRIKDARKKVILILCGCFIYFLIPPVLNYIASGLSYGEMAVRFREVATFMTTGDAGYNLGGRFFLYGETIKAFFASPVYGNRDLIYDGHATFLTVFADLGIIGAIPYCCLYAKARQEILNLIPQEKETFNILFMMLVLMGLTNPIHAALPVMFTLWFVLPLLLHYCSTYTSKRS